MTIKPKHKLTHPPVSQEPKRKRSSLKKRGAIAAGAVAVVAAAAGIATAVRHRDELKKAVGAA
ncbi:hypothetical protein [Sphingomonas sp. ID0503]|uniref:hypothetical protein n=1 Tax=Sphingomonas sp. ID0503 TaxID=3399691 RepID=UPI003AFA1BD4